MIFYNVWFSTCRCVGSSPIWSGTNDKRATRSNKLWNVMQWADEGATSIKITGRSSLFSSPQPWGETVFFTHQEDVNNLCITWSRFYTKEHRIGRCAGENSFLWAPRRALQRGHANRVGESLGNIIIREIQQQTKISGAVHGKSIAHCFRRKLALKISRCLYCCRAHLHFVDTC